MIVATLWRRSCDDGAQAAFGSVWSGAIVLTRSPGGGRTGSAAAGLGCDCGRYGECGCCGPSWYVAGCRNEIVPKGRRHATSDVSPISEAAVRPVSLICGAGGDRTSSSAGLLHAGGCAPARTNSFNDFAGVAAQRCNPKRRFGVSRDDSAMACRSICSPPRAGEACAQRGIANLCGGTIGRVRRRSELVSCSRPGCAPERPPAWSPEQIARRLPVDYPDDETMRISHKAIYQALFVQSRGALRRDLTACLRTGRVLRMPRARTRGRGKTFISPEIMISQRPAEAVDRAVPGHWEGDLILGLGSSAIGTLVERMTRFTLLLHLPRMTDHGHEARVKNGPALAGHGAEAVCDAITRTIITLPEQLRRSLTWDQGAEMAQHARLKIDAGIQVYFCDPHSPWQPGTNENTNGLLRQYFPKGTDLSLHSADDIAAVAAALNSRPRKTLGWKTPAEALDAWLR